MPQRSQSSSFRSTGQIEWPTSLRLTDVSTRGVVVRRARKDVVDTSVVPIEILACGRQDIFYRETFHFEPDIILSATLHEARTYYIHIDVND